MVYDDSPVKDRTSDKSGYSIHKPIKNREIEDVTDLHYTIFTDDGKGNGDIVCFAPSEHWAVSIAEALDAYDDRERWHKG